MAHAKLELAFARAALERAHAARLEGELEVVLRELLAAWAFVRDRSLGRVIFALTRETFELRPAVTDESQWLSRAQAAAGDPVEVGRLLDKIPRRPSLLLPGLRALMEGPPDPRVAAAIMRRFEIDTWLLGLPEAAPHLDPTHRSQLRMSGLRVQPDMRQAVYAARALLDARLDLRCCELDLGGLALLGAIAERRPAPPVEDQRELALLVEIATHPQQLEPRSVYADYLLARGPHAHAEFVVLQLQAASEGVTPAVEARMYELLAANKRAWLGKLADCFELTSLEWRGGFGARGRIHSRRDSGPLIVAEERCLFDHPGLRTFTELQGVSADFEARRS